jgi:predicted MPP superfamily phosphohydrolase
MMKTARAGTLLGGVAGAAVGWGWFEAGWVRLRTLDVSLPRLPTDLAGLRIAHLSDFHFGLPSRGAVAAERAVDWVAERQPDLVAVTGDLVSRPSGELVDEDAELRILLCHFPYVLGFLPPGAFDLVLSGHMHDGQIALPLGRDRKYRFAHRSTRYNTGLYVQPGGTMHISPGLGTTFVPFRFFARPEATELMLQRP